VVPLSPVVVAAALLPELLPPQPDSSTRAAVVDRIPIEYRLIGSRFIIFSKPRLA
jgi:hypothetical protein